MARETEVREEETQKSLRPWQTIVRAMYLTMTEKGSHLRREVTGSDVFYQDHSGC